MINKAKRALMALASITVASTASAQQACAQWEGLVAYLAEEHGETLHSRGRSGGAFVEIYVSTETGTWTVLVLGPNGIACVATVGTDFVVSDPPPPGEAI